MGMRFKRGGRYQPQKQTTDEYTQELEREAEKRRRADKAEVKWRVYTKERKEPATTTIAEHAYKGEEPQTDETPGGHRWTTFIDYTPASDEDVEFLEEQSDQTYRELRDDENVAGVDDSGADDRPRAHH